MDPKISVEDRPQVLSPSVYPSRFFHRSGKSGPQRAAFLKASNTARRFVFSICFRLGCEAGWTFVVAVYVVGGDLTTVTETDGAFHTSNYILRSFGQGVADLATDPNMSLMQ